jgi:hypothetical protein
MRTRKEIEQSLDTNATINQCLTIEVLLDIRGILRRQKNGQKNNKNKKR